MKRISPRCLVLGLIICGALARAPEGVAQSLAATKDSSTIKITTANGKPLLEYRYADVPFKPYALQLRSPSGVAVLRDSPADHKHHHGLMFAISAEGTSFWIETDKGGKQVQRRLDGPTTTASAAEFTQLLDWTTPDGKVALCEERTLKVHAEPGLPATLLTWRSRLATPPGRDAVTLGGSHYYGLGARFVETMDKVGGHINAAGQPGEVVRGQERLVAAKWDAYSGPAGDKPVTFAIFDHPNNLRHPARMFTMTTHFAYLSATLNLWKEPFQLKAGAPLELRYGVAVWDGKAAAEHVEKLYQQWAK